MPSVKPYHQCSSRLELRTSETPTRAWVDNMVESVRELGVEAVVGSAVDNYCRPFFPSAFYPRSHADANREIFHYWVESLHAIGRPVLSWLAINHGAGQLEDHPDWRVKLIPDSAGRVGQPDGDHYPCINSPHGKLLPDFAAEMVRELGFDGVWFDGSSLGVNNNTLPGCVCAFCVRRFREDTGLAIPERVDWSSRAFRVWVNWRYDILMDLWKRCLDAVTAVNPQATVCFNNYRRVRHGGIAWATGIPMRKLGWDCLMSGELDLQVFHADFQMKMHRMYGCLRGQDTWMALCDHWQMWVPDVEVEPVRHAAIGAAAAGGVMWMGTGVEPRLNPPVFRVARETTEPLMPFMEGEPVEYAAIWASQQTQDFYWQDNPQGAWDGWHGANELCHYSHVPGSIVFDEHVTEGLIVGRYPVLLAGNAACVSDKQADRLHRYVEEGGVLVACADAGVFDEMGWPHKKPILDDLLGVTARQAGTLRATLELTDESLAAAGGRWHTCPGRHVLATPSGDARLLANVVETGGGGSWDNYESNGVPRLPRVPGAWVVTRGRGKVVYLGVDFPAAHQQAPKIMQVHFFRALLASLAVPAVSLDGPLQVVLNARRRRDGTMIVHLHNAPGSIWRHGQPANGAAVEPVRDLHLRIHEGRIHYACSGLTGTVFPISPDGRSVHIRELSYNDVVEIR